jgi:hypothetical protein
LLLLRPIALCNVERGTTSTRNFHRVLGLRLRIWTELRYLTLVLVAYLALLSLRAIPSLLILARIKSKRIIKVDGISPGIPVQVQAAGQAEGIFLRKTPDRREIVDAEQCR